MELYERLWLPDGDPSKITNADEIDDAYIRGDLGKADFTDVRREAEESQTVEGRRLAAHKANLIASIRAQITASNPQAGKTDRAGDLQLYRFGLDVQSKVDDYRAAGKNPRDLFDPSKPDYLGRPDIIAMYQPPVRD